MALIGAERRPAAPGHAAVEVLRTNGVGVVFGLNGDHVLKLYEGPADAPVGAGNSAVDQVARS